MGGNRLENILAENERLKHELESRKRIEAVRGQVLIGQNIDALVQLGVAAENGHQGAKGMLQELHAAWERTRLQAHGLTVVEDGKAGT